MAAPSGRIVPYRYGNVLAIRSLVSVRVHASLASDLSHVLSISAHRLAAFLRDFALLLLIHCSKTSCPVVSVSLHLEPPNVLDLFATPPSLTGFKSL